MINGGIWGHIDLVGNICKFFLNKHLINLLGVENNRNVSIEITHNTLIRKDLRMNQIDAYKAIKTDLKKLETNIARRQKWCNEEAKKQNLDMARMYEKDVKDLTDILNYIHDGDYESAWGIIEWVDTAVRDDIPVRLYNFIAKENGYN